MEHRQLVTQVEDLDVLLELALAVDAEQLEETTGDEVDEREGTTGQRGVRRSAGQAWCAEICTLHAPGPGLFAGARILGALVGWSPHPVGPAYLSDRFPKPDLRALDPACWYLPLSGASLAHCFPKRRN